MKTIIDTKLLVNVAGWAFGVLGIGYAIGVHTDMNRACKKLDCTIEGLAHRADIRVSDDIIQDAVARAVREKADYVAQLAVNDMKADMKRESVRQVKAAVSKEYNTLQESVRKEIKAQVGEIDIYDLREEVKTEAKEKMAEKMDDILVGFNDNLTNIGKIYGSIANVVTNHDSKDNIIRIS